MSLLTSVIKNEKVGTECKAKEKMQQEKVRSGKHASEEEVIQLPSWA